MIDFYWMSQAVRHGLIMEQDEIAKLGASLRQIDRKLLAQTKKNDSQRIWLQGGEPYFDVFVELRENSIEWFQFTLRGKSLSWNKQRSGWQTGKTNEMRSDDTSFYSASKLIQTDNQLDFAFIQLAYSILQTRAGEDIFDKMLSLFQIE